jgi:hypothetical protein
MRTGSDKGGLGLSWHEHQVAYYATYSPIKFSADTIFKLPMQFKNSI